MNSGQRAGVTGPVCFACFAALDGAKRIGPLSPDPSDPLLSDFPDVAAGGLFLRCCPSCGSLVRDDERCNEQKLLQAYARQSAAYWDGLNQKQDSTARMITAIPSLPTSPEVWDVGCGAGDLLLALPSSWRKRGVDPGVAAVRKAKERGLDVRQGTLTTLLPEPSADLVLLIDTVEHLTNPLEDLQRTRQMLTSGGQVVILTGAADRIVPRWMRSTWYYLRCVGHISIFSRKGLDVLLGRAGFAVNYRSLVSHPGGASALNLLRRLGGNALRRLSGREPAFTQMYRDHQLVVANRL